MKESDSRSFSLKRKVAREAALLLYTSQEKEYKQAKKRAVENLGARVLPSNLEVARELDAIAEDREGALRHERLIRMRKEAFKIMQILKDFNPRLIGSVWRGTINKNSDIDIVVFASEPNAVLVQLQKSRFSIARTEWLSVTKEGKEASSFHIYLALPSGNVAEVVVRSADKMNRYGKCEIYGDLTIGLDSPQLARVLKEDSLARFVP